MSPELRFTLRLPAEAPLGEEVRIALAAKNAGRNPLDLYLRGRTIAFDVIVRDAAGSMIWQRLAGEITQAVLQLKTLAPGESMVLTARWDQRTNAGVPVQPGVYSVHGLLLTDDSPLQTDIRTITLRPPPA